MSLVDSRTVLNIINENFGQVIHDVAEKLNCICGVSVKSLISEFKNKYDKPQVQKSVITLLNHNLIENISTDSSVVAYSLNFQNIFFLTYRSLFLEILHNKYGLHSVAIMKVLFDKGIYPLKKLIKEAIKSFEITRDSQKILESLIFLFKMEAFKLFTMENDQHQEMSSINFESILKDVLENDLPHDTTTNTIPPGDVDPRKRSYQDLERSFYGSIFTKPNYELLTGILMDQIISEFFRNKYDESAASIVSTILGIQRSRNPSYSIFNQQSVSIEEIIDKLPPIPRVNGETLKLYLTSLSGQSKNYYIKSVQDKLGKFYVLDTKTIILVLCKENLSWVVSERYGIRAKRIFNLMQSKSYLEQKQISDLSMIPFKETKETLYSLFEDGLVELHSIPKTADANPLTSQYLFRVSFSKCVPEVLQYCKQFLSNIIEKRVSLYTSIRHLFEKNAGTNDMISKDPHITLSHIAAKSDQISQMITHSNTLELKNIQNSISQLDFAEANLVKTMFIFEYHKPCI